MTASRHAQEAMSVSRAILIIASDFVLFVYTERFGIRRSFHGEPTYSSIRPTEKAKSTVPSLPSKCPSDLVIGIYSIRNRTDRAFWVERRCCSIRRLYETMHMRAVDHVISGEGAIIIDAVHVG